MNKSPIRRFWNLLSQYKNQLRQIYIFAIFNGIVNLTLPLGIQAIINFIQTGEVSSSWILLVSFVLIGIAITGILQILQLRVVEDIQQDLFARSAFEFAYRLPKISLIQLDKLHTPELVNRFFDTLTIQKGLPKILIDFSLASFQIVFGLILLAVYSPYFIVLGLILLFIMWLIFQITGPKGLKTSLKESKYKYKIAHWLEEIGRVNNSFKLNVAGAFHLQKTDEAAAEYLIAREKHFNVLLNQFSLFIGFKVLVAAGLLLLGGFLVFQEQMNIGQFVAAEIIIILVINSVEKILRVIDTIYDVLTALEKIGYVTDLNLDKDKGKLKLENGKGLSIEAQNIEFGFPDSKKPIFENLSIKIDSHDKVLLEGESGSGKSILLRILSGVHSIQQGELFFNETPFSHYERSSFYAKIGMAFPTNQLFEGTLRENIRMGRNISDKEINKIIKLLGLDQYINLQTQGIDSLIDSGGRRLPRSVIQKLQIARTIVGKPLLLLLEDPLQFVNESEKKKIIDYIMSPDRDWTVIVIADCPHWKSKATKIIELAR